LLTRRTPEEPEWHRTDDTAMAPGILRVPDEHGEIRQAACTSYCPLLPLPLHEPHRRRELARELFEGRGGLGHRREPLSGAGV
jgi:hypothetical protein